MNWYRLYYMMVDYNVGIIFVYLPVFMRNFFGFNEIQIGKLYLWAGIIAIIGSIISALIAQKIKDERKVVRVGSIMMLLSVIMLYLNHQFSFVFFVFIFLFFMRSAIYVIGDELIINYLNAHKELKIDYGKIRSFGSLGWGMNFLINGIIVSNFPKMLVISWLIGIILLILATFKMPKAKVIHHETEKFEFSKIKSLFTKKNYLIFIIVNSLLWGTINNMQSYSQFMVEDLGGTLTIYGLMNSIILIVDFLVMNNSPKVNKKLGDKKYYRFVAILLLIKYGLIALAHNPTLIYISVLIDPFFFGLIVPFSSKYIKSEISTDLSTVALSLEKVFAQCFAAIGSIIFGYLYAYYGGSIVFILMAIIVIINLIVASRIKFKS